MDDADRWTSRAWTTEERRALSGAGLGPAWRVARKAIGWAACPTCGAAMWASCMGAEVLHVDRLFAAAANIRAQKIGPPEAVAVESVAAIVRTMRLQVGEEVSRASLADIDPGLRVAVHHGLLRLATAPERWMLSDYGAECWRAQ